jgi:NAD dependent epimerase/dehydratase
MKKIALVTGADGFIGSHLAEMLSERGYQVRGLVQYNSLNSWGWLENSMKLNQMEIVSGDIRDAYFCKKFVKNVDVIFHLAALIAIPYSYSAPQSYIDTNVHGTSNICLAALEGGVKRLIHTSTSEVYGTAQFVPMTEEHPLQPQSPYSASKIAADAMAMSYHLSMDLPLTIVRPFNTYGPRQSARAVIPNIISQLVSGKNEIRIGDVTPTRDFNYVEDTCRGFIQAAECEDAVGEVINLATETEISIGDLFHRIQSLLKTSAELIMDHERIRPPGSEVFRLFGSNQKAKKIIGYSPKVSIDEGLEKTIAWFSKPENLRMYKVGIYNV